MSELLNAIDESMRGYNSPFLLATDDSTIQALKEVVGDFEPIDSSCSVCGEDGRRSYKGKWYCSKHFHERYSEKSAYEEVIEVSIICPFCELDVGNIEGKICPKCGAEYSYGYDGEVKFMLDKQNNSLNGSKINEE